MKQLITPNPDIWCRPGWCLEYVNNAFGVKEVYGSATAAWEGSSTKHRDRNFPKGVWTPVWYALDTTPLGHVVLLAPDGSVYSTSDLTNTPHHHPDLADLEAYYAYYGMTLTYRGWTEDVEGTRVMQPTTQTIKEDTLSATEVAEIKRHITAEADRVIAENNDYVGRLLVSGYKIGTQEFPGISKVDIVNQQTLRTVLGVTKGIAAAVASGSDLTPDQIEAAVAKALQENSVDVKVSVVGKPEVL